MKVRVCFHDKCFDGAASASVFSRFFRERMDPGAEFLYTGMTHKASQPFEEGMFDGDENAIVDFKYSSSPRLTWWFDHHQSAFLTPEDGAHFRADRSGRKFYDPSYKSCTKYLATVAAEKFGFDASPLAELIHWGDVIDGAQFESPQMAVALAEPALQLALVIEAAPDPMLVPNLIPYMANHPLFRAGAAPDGRRATGPAAGTASRQHGNSQSQRIDARDGVIFFDVSDLQLEGYNKFIPYMLHPELPVFRRHQRFGHAAPRFPWVPTPGWKWIHEGMNLASLCERYGGGGHARVAAISFGPGDLERARQAAKEITAILRSRHR